MYGALIGLIVLFSLGFAYFGRRGHDEANSVNSVAVARQLPGGALDVTSWSNVFVINGADYAIVHGGTGRLVFDRAIVRGGQRRHPQWRPRKV